MSKLAFFADHPVFKNLDEDELRALCQIVREYAFDAKSVIAFQRDIADCMYLVRNGRLFAREVDEHGRVRDANTRSYHEGEYFGAEWLFTPGTFPATVTGRESGRIYVIEREHFLNFLKNYPNAINHLAPDNDFAENPVGLPPNAWEEASKLTLVERRDRIGAIRLLPDELVEYYSRRSVWFLAARVFWPLLGMIISLALLFLFTPPGDPVIVTIRNVVMIVVVIVFGSMAIFRFLDWTNDYFVITNKHISNREFDLLTFRTELNKVPIGQVQSIEVLKPDFMSNLFDIGTVRITTASTVGTILFDNIDNPIEVESVLRRLQRYVRDYDAALAQTKMRQSLESHFGLEPGFEIVPDNNEEAGESFVTRARRGLWRQFLDFIDWREVDGDVITYRKNYLVLLYDILWPSLIYILLTAALFGITYFTEVPIAWMVLIFAPFFLLNTFWFIWMFEDWRNDIFQLTDRYVIDIDRKPFGFGESRKQALLSNIQNVSAERPGFWSTLFDYGDVNIETAGAEADIVFDHVPKPSQVLSEIFDRLDNVRQNQRRREGAERREEYALLLDVYKQEMEQHRIPQRTPPPGYVAPEEP